MQEVSFAKACKEYFGFKPGQNLAEFLAELKELTNQDREDLAKMFPSVGYKII